MGWCYSIPLEKPLGVRESSVRKQVTRNMHVKGVFCLWSFLPNPVIVLLFFLLLLCGPKP